MKMLTTGLIFLLSCMVYSQIYFWEDENGVKHYSSTPPPENAGVTDCKKKDTASPEQIEQEKQALEEAIAEQQRERNAYPRIVMYSSRGSRACQAARNFFKENRIHYQDRVIEESEENFKAFQAFGVEGVPYILVGDKEVKGWNEGLIRILLGMN